MQTQDSVSFVGSVQFRRSSHVWLFATPWTEARQASLSITNLQSLLKLIESVIPSNHLILCHPFVLLPSIFYLLAPNSKEKICQHSLLLTGELSTADVTNGGIEIRARRDLAAVLAQRPLKLSKLTWRQRPHLKPQKCKSTCCLHICRWSLLTDGLCYYIDSTNQDLLTPTL